MSRRLNKDTIVCIHNGVESFLFSYGILLSKVCIMCSVCQIFNDAHSNTSYIGWLFYQLVREESDHSQLPFFFNCVYIVSVLYFLIYLCMCDMYEYVYK